MPMSTALCGRLGGNPRRNSMHMHTSYPADQFALHKMDQPQEMSVEKMMTEMEDCPMCKPTPVDLNHGFVPMDKHGKDNMMMVQYSMRARHGLMSEEDM